MDTKLRECSFQVLTLNLNDSESECPLKFAPKAPSLSHPSPCPGAQSGQK